MTIISVDKAGVIYLEKKQIENSEELKNRLQDLYERNPKTVIYLEGSEESKFKKFIEVLDVLKQTGFESISIGTKPQ